MRRPQVSPSQFAFRATVTFRSARDWPSAIWKALAAANGVKGAIEEGYFGSSPRYPAVLRGTFEVGANVLATRAPQGFNAQVVHLSFAAFKDGKLAGWSEDLAGTWRSTRRTWFGGCYLKDGRMDDERPVVIKPQLLRKLIAEGRRLRKQGAPTPSDDGNVTKPSRTSPRARSSRGARKAAKRPASKR
ncbi:MAG: hypothetical protein ACOZQL_20795 [Myxococcota bacterium]